MNKTNLLQKNCLLILYFSYILVIHIRIIIRNRENSWVCISLKIVVSNPNFAVAKREIERDQLEIYFMF